MFPYFLVFLKYFCDKYGVRGSRFSRFVGRSKNVPKSIAIDQESIISNWGIIKTPKKQIIQLKTRKTKHVFIAVFSALLDPVLGLEEDESAV